jgi:Tfp pilus assembly protein FimT
MNWHWDEQRGSTLLEMAIAISIFVLMTSLAMISGVGLVTNSRLSRTASQVADQLAFARVNAITGYQQWRIRFIPTAGSDVVQSYVVEWCAIAAGSSPGTSCAGTWTQQTQITVDLGIGLKPLDDQQNPVSTLTFDRTGLLLRRNTEVYTDVQVCSAGITAGILTCNAGTARLVRIHAFSGVVEN